MFFIAFIRYLRGYVRFSAQGAFVERFLNLLARARIAVWDGRRRDGVYTGFVAARAYPAMRELAKKSGGRLRVVSKHGLPFKEKRLKKRRGLVIGFAVFAAFLFAMSQFIWSIQVNGNKSVPEEEILAALEDLGIRPGRLRAGINVREAEAKALLALGDLSWIALNIDGSAIHVEVNESLPIPPMIDPGDPCNVVAAKSGQILELRVYMGQAVLQQGDAVLEGQAIVSGVTQDRRGQNTFRHARADILAEVQHTITVQVPLQQTTYIETGKTARRDYLRVFGYELPVFLPWSIPRPYLVERQTHPLVIFSVELPLAHRSEQFTLMREVPVTYTEQEAKALAIQELEALQALELGDAEIIDRSLRADVRDGVYTLTADYIAHMNIAAEKAILTGQSAGE